MPLLTKKNTKGRLEHAKMHSLWVYPNVLEECFMKWCDPTRTFLDPWISGMSGPKKAKLMSKEHHLHGQTWRRTSLVMGVFYCCRKWKSWLYEEHHGLFEVSGHFGKNLDAFGTKTEDWWSMDFLAGQSSQSIHPNLLMLGSGISCRMFLSGLLSLQI